jgi:hypothetical protein
MSASDLMTRPTPALRSDDSTVGTPEPQLAPQAPADYHLSVVVPVSRESDTLRQDHERHAAALAEFGPVEFIYVLDGQFPRTAAALEDLSREAGHSVRALVFNQTFGEAAALSVGLSTPAPPGS